MKKNDKIKVYLHGLDKSNFWYREPENTFEVIEVNGKLGINYNTNKSPYTCKGGEFVPFEAFASTVIFENVETKEHFHFSNIENRVVRVA